MSSRRILLVEDNIDSADMLARRLRRRGFEVAVVDNGRDALTAARVALPDVMLLDMSLPGMDGWTVAAELKADEATRSIPIIAVTAHTMSDDEARARAAGCDDFHAKPVDFARLLIQLEEHL